MKRYFCIWKGKEVRPTETTCFWLFGNKPECSSYSNGDSLGRCAFLYDAEDLEKLDLESGR